MLKLRSICILGLLVCVGLLTYALYLEHVLLLEPCPLCWLQRFVFVGFAAAFLVCAIHNPRSWTRYLYALVFAILTLLGAGLAGRQLWLQSLPPEARPECGLGISYMLESESLMNVLAWAARGTGECAEVQWTFAGISIPGWTFMAFLVLGIVVIVSLLRSPRGERAIFR